MQVAHRSTEGSLAGQSAELFRVAEGGNGAMKVQAQGVRCNRARRALPLRRQLQPGPMQCSASATDTAKSDSEEDAKRAQLKKQMLEKAAKIDRGASASKEDTEEMEQLFAELEKLNPTPKPLKADVSNGKWELKYTTSQGILGTSRPAILRPRGPIYQFIDLENARARNQESWPLWNAVEAALTPKNDSFVSVRFTYFFLLNFIPVKAPDSARGMVILPFTFLEFMH